MSLWQYKDANRSELWEILQIQLEETQRLTAELEAARPEIDMDNLRNCILMALNDCLVAEVGPGHTVINIDGESLFNRVRGILDAITPLPAPPEGE